ncbi:hypothetical protein DMENIID0001_024700 [Sergentomyia squamirostris]
MFKERSCSAHPGGGGLSLDSNLIDEVCQLVERLHRLEQWGVLPRVSEITVNDEVEDCRRLQDLLERFRKFCQGVGVMSADRDLISTTSSTAVTDDNPTNGQKTRTKECDAFAITEEDIRALVRELKRKIDYTEMMNWLSPPTILVACSPFISNTDHTTSILTIELLL